MTRRERTAAEKRNLLCVRFSEIWGTNIFPSGRWAELAHQINLCIYQVFDGDDKVVDCVKIVKIPSDSDATSGVIYTQMLHDPEWTYMKGQILKTLLTDDEVDLLLNRADDIARFNCAQKEKERFDKAKKINEADWAGPIMHGDQYYDSVADLRDMMDPEELEDVEFVWATKERRVIPSLSVAEIVENDFFDNGWEDMEVDDLNGVEELQKALDKFVEENKGVVSYHEDNSIAIVLQKGVK